MLFSKKGAEGIQFPKRYLEKACPSGKNGFGHDAPTGTGKTYAVWIHSVTGWLDLVSPRQVVMSHGRLQDVKAPTPKK